MKKLLLICILLLSFSCGKNEEGGVKPFVTFGQIVYYDKTTLEMKTDDSKKVVFTLNGEIAGAMTGQRIIAWGGLKSVTEQSYDAELYQIGYVDIKNIVKKEDVEESELGHDGLTVTDIIASGGYLNLFIPTKNHSVTLVVQEVKQSGDSLIIRMELYNKTNEMLKEENILSFDISDYLSFSQVTIELKYKDNQGLIVDRTIEIPHQ